MTSKFAPYFVLLGWFLIASCSAPETSNEQNPQDVKASIPATEVKVVKATVRPFEYLISASGRIASASEVRMQFRRSGIIEKIYVANGHVVSRGQILAVLSNENQKLTLAKAELFLKEKRLAFDDQVLSYVNDSLRRKQATENIRISSGLAAAELSYQESKLEFENSFVRAQIPGIVSGIELNAGSPVNQGDLLCFVHDEGNLLVQAEVLESDALSLNRGASAEIRPVASAETSFPAKIESINPRVDERTGLVRVVLRLTAKSKALPGMHVQVVMHLPYSKNIIVPKEAVVMRSGKMVVFTASENLAKWNYVTTGRDNGKEIEILSGLKDGDDVIITNNLQLAHDAAITVTTNDK